MIEALARGLAQRVVYTNKGLPAKNHRQVAKQEQNGVQTPPGKGNPTVKNHKQVVKQEENEIQTTPRGNELLKNGVGGTPKMPASFVT